MHANRYPYAIPALVPGGDKCGSKAYLDKIPAFAGMTSNRSISALSDSHR